MEDTESVESVMESALNEAQRRGYGATGWAIQHDEEAGYAAWLYQEDEVSACQEPIAGMKSVACWPTMAEAATACLDAACSLVYIQVEAEA